ncbi:MAG: hypothetical protein AB7H70_15805 [Rhodospirillaceae bacterium]
MNKSLFLVAAIACTAIWTAADAATFRAETHARGYTVFSTYEKPEQCEVVLNFTFMHNGTRDKGESLCVFKDVPEGKDVKFCEFSHERMVDPIMSGPLLPTCKPLQ